MFLNEFSSGALFGLGLFSAGVWAPNIIKGQMDFSSNVMITVMMGASAASAIAMDIMDRLHRMQKKLSRPSNIGFFEYDGNVLGGVLIGIGMGATGACPGTSFIQAGAGLLNGVYVILGGVLGALTFIKLQPSLKRARARFEDAMASSGGHCDLSRLESARAKDIASALGINPVVVLLVWIPMCVSVVQIALAQDDTIRKVSSAGLVPPAYGGLMIGVAQLATMLLAGHTLGASMAYEDVARWIDSKPSKATFGDDAKPPFLTSSVSFAVGSLCAAALLKCATLLTGRSVGESSLNMDATAIALAVVGGWAMVLGARIAGGCTSGHGISGLAKFSLSSLVTTACLFGAGIVTVGILGR